MPNINASNVLRNEKYRHGLASLIRRLACRQSPQPLMLLILHRHLGHHGSGAERGRDVREAAQEHKTLSISW